MVSEAWLKKWGEPPQGALTPDCNIVATSWQGGEMPESIDVLLHDDATMVGIYGFCARTAMHERTLAGEVSRDYLVFDGSRPPACGTCHGPTRIADPIWVYQSRGGPSRVIRLDLVERAASTLAALSPENLERLLALSKRLDNGELTPDQLNAEVRKDKGLRYVFAGWKRSEVIAVAQWLTTIAAVIVAFYVGTHKASTPSGVELAPDQLQQIINQLLLTKR